MSLIPLSCTFLGTWQLCRHYEKKRKYDLLNETSIQEPIIINKTNQLDSITEGQFIILQGAFSNDISFFPYETVFLGPRLPPKEEVGSVLGYHLIKRFDLAQEHHKNKPILVNLGWIPRDILKSTSDTISGTVFNSFLF